VDVLIRGGLFWCGGDVLTVAASSGRAVLTGQKSAEVVVPTGSCGLGRAERWELMCSKQSYS